MIELQSSGYRLCVDPALGGTVTLAEWSGVPLLQPLEDRSALKAGCFVMAPFANRIADGRFIFAGRAYQVPLNSPAEGMATHGFARDQPWDVAERAADHAVLRQELAAAGWHYRIEQRIEVSASGIAIGLTITNTGAAAMPFGLGLHPWFPKPAGTMVQFDADPPFARDVRGLPLVATDPMPDFAQPLDLLPRVDACFAGWGGTARIVWPDRNTRLDLRGGGAFRHVQVFVPDDRPSFCIEPVSHAPDALNRPAVPQMKVLEPQQSLSGSMAMRATIAG